MLERFQDIDAECWVDKNEKYLYFYNVVCYLHLAPAKNLLDHHPASQNPRS